MKKRKLIDDKLHRFRTFLWASCCSESFATRTVKDLLNWCHWELCTQWRNIDVV